MSGTRRWVLGVDFGTTTTAAATRELSQVRAEPVRFGDQNRMPSAVLLDDTGQPIAGPHVELQAAVTPERVERRPKQRLGQGPVLLHTTWVQDVDLVAAVLGHVRTEALRLHGGRLPDAVWLTHPARWESLRQERLRDAASRAELGEVELCLEPVAAATALLNRVGRESLPEGSLVAVFDFGGGTLDIALLRLHETFELAGPPGGDEHLGGENVNDLLVRFLVNQLPERERTGLLAPEETDDPAGWQRAAYRFAQDVRSAKEALAFQNRVQLALIPPARAPVLELSDVDLRAQISALVRSAAESLEATVRQAGYTPDDLATIYLVGGSSRLALVQRVLGSRFAAPIETEGDPKALVALGAAERRPAGGAAPHSTVLAEPAPEPTAESPDATAPITIPEQPDPQPAEPPRAAVFTEPPQAPVLTAAPGGAAAAPGGAAAAPGGAAAAPDQPMPIPGPFTPHPLIASPSSPRLHALTVRDALGLYRLDDPGTITLDRWLTMPGTSVTVGDALAVVRGANLPAAGWAVRSLHSGIVAALRSPEGADLATSATLLELADVALAVDVPGQREQAGCGFVLALDPPPPFDPQGGAAIVVKVSGRVLGGLWWAGRFLLPVRPGKHAVSVQFQLFGKWAGAAGCFVTPAPGVWPTLRYIPPQAGRGRGQLKQT